MYLYTWGNTEPSLVKMDCQWIKDTGWGSGVSSAPGILHLLWPLGELLTFLFLCLTDKMKGQQVYGSSSEAHFNIRKMTLEIQVKSMCLRKTKLTKDYSLDKLREFNMFLSGFRSNSL